jgi:uncharacterized glyoxalase superfamily protein PhnB
MSTPGIPAPGIPAPQVWPSLRARDARALIRFGSTREGSEIAAPSLAGTFCGYAVTDEPDALYRRAVAAGAQVTREMEDADYGSRGFTVRDPEGNQWSFGTYRGEPRT